MATSRIAAYRSVVREVYKAVSCCIDSLSSNSEAPNQSVSPRSTRNKTITANFRSIFSARRKPEEQSQFDRDMENVVTFMRSQRMHRVRRLMTLRQKLTHTPRQTLLERYNPLHDMSVEERVKATARRVGLDMPINSNGTKEE